MFRALCAHHQEVKIVLYSIWYRHTETSEWFKILYVYNILNNVYIINRHSAFLISFTAG